MRPDGGRERRWRFSWSGSWSGSWGWLVAPLAVGMLLRLWRLPQQVLGGDEIHAVRVALNIDLPAILTTYFRADPCLPLTAFFRLWLSCGGVLTDAVLRAPVLITAVAFLVAAPLLVARGFGQRTATVFAWLAAISPGLVLYGRIVRSYMPIVLFGCLAAAAFWIWWRGGGRRWGALYVLCAALALWFHLGAGPFVVAPFVYAAGELAVSRLGSRRRSGWRVLLALGAVTVAAFLAVLVPAGSSLLELMPGKSIEQSVGLSVVGESLRLAAGTASVALAGVFWVLAAAGWVILLRRRPSLGLYSAVLVVVHSVGIRILSPLGLAHPLILFRYHLIALPVVLVWGAVALTALPPFRQRPRSPGSQLAMTGIWAAWIAVLLLAGPLASADFRHGSFHHHNDFMTFTRQGPKLAENEVPGIYRRLAAGTPLGPGPVLEYPWTDVWNRNQTVPLYQQLHGRDVLVAPAEDFLYGARVRLRNVVAADREAFFASRARVLIVHLDPGLEESRVLGASGRSELLRRFPEERRRLAQMARRMAGWLERSWGPPVYQDRWVRVWDLGAVRAAELSSGRPSGSSDPGASSKGDR